jgi:uncharacterized protein (TIGR01777 family)
LVGSALYEKLVRNNVEVVRLSRSQSANKSSSDIVWDDASGSVEAVLLEGFDAVIHLAGESIASGRWTATKKERIRNSRVGPTRRLSEILSNLKTPPKLFLSASAIGFYGHRGDEALKETSPVGQGYLPEVCQEWETSARGVNNKGIRTAQLRIGIVLSPKGGALVQMLTPFKMGVGGKLGSGQQYMSWIALEDLVEIILFVLKDNSLEGPINTVSPFPVTNSEFTRALGQVLHRPTLFPVPSIMARLAFGEMADALLLASTRVLPEKLLKSGFEFRYPQLASALRFELQK